MNKIIRLGSPWSDSWGLFICSRSGNKYEGVLIVVQGDHFFRLLRSSGGTEEMVKLLRLDNLCKFPDFCITFLILS